MDDRVNPFQGIIETGGATEVDPHRFDCSFPLHGGRSPSLSGRSSARTQCPRCSASATT